ncbi:MAG TPA: AbrB/MazE/SpoVT family DNA-binding domain-containing protein [Gemmatimonadota bacterium]|nr:AbrB/MazE/SpoVT family DNA-binding domain-containing protein [Gemmatimonadota bacterium]
MRTRIGRWGNSLAVRIPKDLAEEARLEVETAVELSVKGDRLVVEPAPERWALPDLLNRVTKENLHEEVDIGPPVGREVW